MKRELATIVVAVSGVIGCAHQGGAGGQASGAGGATTHAIALPGAPATGGVMLDYLAYDRGHRRVWVPAGNTGSVDVIDVDDGARDAHRRLRHAGDGAPAGSKRTVGPSSATVGDGVVYVGNRGDSTVCAIDAAVAAEGRLRDARLDARRPRLRRRRPRRSG